MRGIDLEKLKEKDSPKDKKQKSLPSPKVKVEAEEARTGKKFADDDKNRLYLDFDNMLYSYISDNNKRFASVDYKSTFTISIGGANFYTTFLNESSLYVNETNGGLISFDEQSLASEDVIKNFISSLENHTKDWADEEKLAIICVYKGAEYYIRMGG